MDTTVQNRLSTIRRNRGVGAADLARRVGVSRQTIYAIEAGTYVPNTEVTLKLARELEVSVEELFSLTPEKHEAAQPLRCEVLSAMPTAAGQPVQVCSLGERLVGVPVNAAPYFLPEADGVISKPGRTRGTAELTVFSDEESYAKRLILAGCDPAVGLLTRGADIVCAAASSRLALNWLIAGKVHIAGMHLKDSDTGEFNVPILRREYPDEDLTVVTFAQWEEGFVTAPRNPKRIKKPEDLANPRITFVNREAGAGSRVLLDSLLDRAGLSADRVPGYDRVVHGHLAAAYAVHTGAADCCIATRSAARTFGLDFVPLQTERYDFVLRRKTLGSAAVQNFLDLLQKASLRRKLEVLAGYDTSRTGAAVV